MEKALDVHPSRVIRRFSSHAEQEIEDLRYWRGQPLAEKVKAVEELAQYFAALHKIDLDAQGPKRFVVRFQRAQR